MTMKLTPETVEGIGAGMTIYERNNAAIELTTQRCGSPAYPCEPCMQIIGALRQSNIHALAAETELARLQQELASATAPVIVQADHPACAACSDGPEVYRPALWCDQCYIARIRDIDTLTQEVARLTAVTEGIKAATEERVAALKSSAEVWHVRYEAQRQAAEAAELGAKAAEQTIKELRTWLEQEANHQIDPRNGVSVGYQEAISDILARLPAVTQTASQEKQ